MAWGESCLRKRRFGVGRQGMLRFSNHRLSLMRQGWVQDPIRCVAARRGSFLPCRCQPVVSWHEARTASLARTTNRIMGICKGKCKWRSRSQCKCKCKCNHEASLLWTISGRGAGLACDCQRRALCFSRLLARLPDLQRSWVEHGAPNVGLTTSRHHHCLLSSRISAVIAIDLSCG